MPTEVLINFLYRMSISKPFPQQRISQFWDYLFGRQEGIHYVLMILRASILSAVLWHYLTRPAEWNYTAFGFQSATLWMTLILAYGLSVLVVSGITVRQLRLQAARERYSKLNYSIEIPRRLVTLQIILDVAFFTAFYALTLDARSDYFLFYFVPILSGVAFIAEKPHRKVCIVTVSSLFVALALICWRSSYEPNNKEKPNIGEVFVSIFCPRAFTLIVASIPIGLIARRDSKLQSVVKQLADSNLRLESSNQELQESRLLYLSLVENMPISVFRKNDKFQFDYGNETFCRFLSTTLEELIGKTDNAFFNIEDASRFQRDDRRVMETGLPFDDVELLRSPSLGPRYIHTIKTPVKTFDGRTVGVQGVFMDVTEKRRAEEELNERLTSAQRALVDSTVQRSMAIIGFHFSHELKQPLARVCMQLEQCKLHFTRGESIEFFDSVRRIKSILDKTHETIEEFITRASRSEFTPKPHNLLSVLEQVRAMLSDRMRQQRVKFVPDYRTNPLEMELDDIFFANMLINIYENALAVMKDGGELQVCAIRSEDGAVVVEISDTGPGFPPAILQGNGYERLPINENRKPRFGLRLVHEYAKLHNGVVKLSSANAGGGGAKITLRFERIKPSFSSSN